MKRILTLAVVLALGLSLGLPTIASADTHAVPLCMDAAGNPVPNCSYTLVQRDVSMLVPSVNPCSGVPGTFTLTFSNFIQHVTVNGALDAKFTSTGTGSASFVPDDATQPSYAGHVEASFGTSVNRNNSVLHDTFNSRLTGTDGSTITAHMVDHASVSAGGIANVFSITSITCG